MELGYKPEKSELQVAGAPPPDAPEMLYPTFGIERDSAEEFMREHGGVKVGDYLTATVRLRVTTLRDSEERYQQGKEVRFSVCELNDVADAEKDEDYDEHGSEEDDDDEDEEGERTGNPAVDHMMRRMRRRGKAS